MIRHAWAALVVLCICPAWLFAQRTALIVKSPQADIHRAPTTASPVIDTAPRGAVLDVTRTLGSWVKVSWPDAPDGVGYVHVSRVTAAAGVQSGRTPGSASAGARPAGAAATPRAYRQAIEAVAQHGTIDTDLIADTGIDAGAAGMYVVPPSHVVGVGGRMNGSTIGFGVSARVWPFDPRRAGRGRRFGIQIDVSRYAVTSPAAPNRTTSVQFAPGLLYALRDRVTDYVWVRPYVGGGANVQRESVVPGIPETRLGYQAFGGGEFTFVTLPRFTLSADAGYRWFRGEPTGLDLGGVAFSVAGHWYLK